MPWRRRTLGRGTPADWYAELHFWRDSARPEKLQLWQGTTPRSSQTVDLAMLHRHRATAIPDNRNTRCRHPPASRSSNQSPHGPDRCQLDLRFTTFPGANGNWPALQRIHVIVEPDFGGCILHEMVSSVHEPLFKIVRPSGCETATQISGAMADGLFDSGARQHQRTTACFLAAISSRAPRLRF